MPFVPVPGWISSLSARPLTLQEELSGLGKSFDPVLCGWSRPDILEPRNAR